MKKQIIKIALYDGWKVKGNGYYERRGMTVPYNMLPYATNLNELHRVALDVCGEMVGYEDKYFAIIDSLPYRPIRNRYTHLIKAVAHGIDYLNSKK
jgi:hypothetical protein